MIDSIPRRLNNTVEMQKDFQAETTNPVVENNNVHDKNLIEKYRPKTYKPYEYLNPFVYDYTNYPSDNPMQKCKVGKGSNLNRTHLYYNILLRSFLPRSRSHRIVILSSSVSIPPLCSFAFLFITSYDFFSPPQEKLS